MNTLICFLFRISMETLPISIETLTHWGRVMHVWVSKLTIIGSDNGLLPGWRQAIILTNAGIWLIRPLETRFRDILIKIHTFSFTKNAFENVVWKIPFCLGLNELTMELHAQLLKQSKGAKIYICKIRYTLHWEITELGFITSTVLTIWNKLSWTISVFLRSWYVAQCNYTYFSTE